MRSASLTLIISLLFSVVCKKSESSTNDATAGNTSATPVTVSKQIGASGGTISATDGSWSLSVPAGALSQSKTISITSNATPTGNVPADLAAKTPVLHFEPAGLVFNTPATLVVSYAQGTMPEAGIEEKMMRYYYINDDSTVTPMTGTVNTSTNTLTAQVPHFSFTTGLTNQIDRVNLGLQSNPVVVQNIADRVIAYFQALPDDAARNAEFQANSALLLPFIAKLLEILGSDVLTAAFPNADFDGDGFPNSNDPLVGTPPPSDVINLGAITGNNYVGLVWGLNYDGYLAGVEVVRKTGGYPASRTDGTIIFNAIATGAMDTGLINGVTYYYKVFVRNTAGVYSPGVTLVATPNFPSTSLWARTTTLGADSSALNSVAVDGVGNAFVVGTHWGAGSYSYGAVSINANGGASGFLLKYTPDGVTQWGKTTQGTDTSSYTRFDSVALDSSGNIYITGYQYGSIDYGNGVTSNVTGATLIKYDNAGNTLWIRVAAGNAQYNQVATYGNGIVYVAGAVNGLSTYTFGSGVTFTGTYLQPPGSGDSEPPLIPDNAVLVKFDGSGNALWAKGALGNGYSVFRGVAVNNSGEAFVAGWQTNCSCSYGALNIATPTVSGMVLRYTVSGLEAWEKHAVASGSVGSGFNAIAIDNTGSPVVAGFQQGTAIYTYDIGASAQASGTGMNPVVVRLASSAWARTITSGTTYAQFTGVATDAGGNIYVSGYQEGTNAISYSNYLTLTGTTQSSSPITIKYFVTGETLWGRTLFSSGFDARLSGIAVGRGGFVYTVGQQHGNETYNYGMATATGAYANGNNALLLQYAE